MSAKKAGKRELEEVSEEDLEEDDEVEVTDDEIDPEDLEGVDVDAVLPVPDDEKDPDDEAADEPNEGEEASLDVILAERAVPKKGAAPDELDDEDDDIMALATDRDLAAVVGPLPEKVDPVKDAQEFVCSNCHLVKAKSQLADASRGLCRDCV